MLQEDVNTKRIAKIKTENDLILTELHKKFDAGNSASGIPSETLPESYQEVLNWIESSFNQDLKSVNGLAVGGTVMDQLVMALAPMYLMNQNLPIWLRNSLNPNTATGAGRRMICQIMNVPIEGARPTIVKLQVKGDANTVVAPLALLISTPDTSNPELKIQLYNLDTITLDNTGSAMADFVSQQWGSVIIEASNVYTIISQVTGVNEVVFNASQSSTVDIGQEEDTDEELKNRTFITINQEAKNGYSVLESELIANLPNATAIVTMINNTDNIGVFPNSQGATTLYSNSIVCSLSCEDNLDNRNAIAKTLYYNRAMPYKYPVNMPSIYQKTATHTDTATNIDYIFPWVQTTPIKVYFNVNIKESHSNYAINDQTIKNAIKNQFQHGGYDHNKVVQGIPFYLQWFNQALSTLGLPSYDISMSFVDKINKTILCSPIWELPTVEDATIAIQWTAQS
jgi:hypothetical protein